MSESLRVADEVWIATALLHRQFPDREDFSVAEIVARAEGEAAAGSGPLRPGFKTHASQHCVANKKPNPGRYRILVETTKGRRRLFRPGDPCHPDRRSGKDAPSPHAVPPAYRALIGWYRMEYAKRRGRRGGGEDPILALRGLGGAMWADEPSDDYVRRLREGWR